MPTEVNSVKSSLLSLLTNYLEHPMDRLVSLFCHGDDFCQIFVPDWQRHLITTGQKKRCRQHRLSTSEMMTILIYFHQSHYRHFKTCYMAHVQK